MERRAFITNAMFAGVASAAVLAGATVATAQNLGQQTKQLGVEAIKKVSNRMDGIEARMDKMERHHKNMIRVGVLGIAVSTGIDLTLLL